MNRIKSTCQRAWRAVTNAARSCKQATLRKVDLIAKKVRDFFWDYPTYAEYVERWTKDINAYCTRKSITAREDNFKIIKLEVAKSTKIKFLYIGGFDICYVIKLIFISISKFVNFILPFVLLFILFPFGGEDGIVKMMWDAMINDQTVITEYKAYAVLIIILGLLVCLIVENAKFAIKENTAKEMKEASLEELGFTLYTAIRDNQFKFK